MNSKKRQPGNDAGREDAGQGKTGGDVTGLGGATPTERRTAGRNAAGKISGEAVTSLGSLEAEIMGLAWEIGRPANAMEITEAALYSRRGQGREPIAFSTIATTMRRLSEKGLLTTGRRPAAAGVLSKREARTPYYAPTVGREEMAVRILDSVSRTLLGRSLHALIPGLAGGLRREKGSADEQERLGRLLQALEQAAEADEPVSE
jgi:predicted transcriptional regulator